MKQAMEWKGDLPTPPPGGIGTLHHLKKQRKMAASPVPEVRWPWQAPEGPPSAEWEGELPAPPPGGVGTLPPSGRPSPPEGATGVPLPPSVRPSPPEGATGVPLPGSYPVDFNPTLPPQLPPGITTQPEGVTWRPETAMPSAPPGAMPSTPPRRPGLPLGGIRDRLSGERIPVSRVLSLLRERLGRLRGTSGRLR